MRRIFKITALTLLLFITHLSIAQEFKDLNFIHNSRGSKVISSINYVSGKINFSTSLKENVIITSEFPKENIIYVSTRHYVYKIDRTTGDVLIEFLHTDILTKEVTEATDPNININPPYNFNQNGVGFTYNPMAKSRELSIEYHKIPRPTSEQSFNFTDAYSKAMGACDLYKIDIKNQSKSLLVSLDKAEYKKSIPFRVINNEIQIYKYDKASLQFNLETYPLDDGKKVDVSPSPIQINPNNNLTSNQDHAKANVNQGFRISTSGTIQMIGCKSNYIGELICPPKKTMPKAPQTYIPKKYNKKGAAEAQEINDKRLKEYQKASDEYIASIGNSNCEIIIYKDSKADENYMHTIVGASIATIWEDQYLFYNDGLDMIMYDLKLKKELWSLSL